MKVLLIIVAVLGFAVNSIFTRYYQLNLQKHRMSIRIYQALFSVIAAVCYIAIGILCNETLSLHILLFSMAFGIFFASAVIFSALCCETGNMSVSVVIINLSLILPVIFSWVFLKESVNMQAVVGLVLLIGAIILSSLSIKQQSSVKLKKWIFYVLTAFVANGMAAIVQKVFKMSAYGDASTYFLGIAYGTATIYFVISFFRNNGAKEFKQYKLSSRLIGNVVFVSAVSGIGSLIGNFLLVRLCTEVSGIILYPCINGGLCIVTAIASFVLFKEKVLITKVIAIITGIIAIVLLNI